MDHDALNQAYDDEVSRLLRELCASTTSSGGKVSSEALNAAYSDEVSRLFREFCAGIDYPPNKLGISSLEMFHAGVQRADKAWDAVNKYWQRLELEELAKQR